jgi:hypothetical protein
VDLARISHRGAASVRALNKNSFREVGEKTPSRGMSGISLYVSVLIHTPDAPEQFFQSAVEVAVQHMKTYNALFCKEFAHLRVDLTDGQ